MIFRSLVFSALCAGLLAGIVFGTAQQFQVTPIIVAAESYESIAPAMVSDGHDHQHTDQSTAQAQGNDASNHDHGADWAPEDGLERTFYTYLTSVLTAIGFALVLASAMSWRDASGWKSGLLWGMAGYLVFFVAPALGLRPEIPGQEAAILQGRQAWWLLAVFATGAGLAVLFFAQSWLKVAGVFLLAIPHLIGAPHPDGPAFTHPDPQIVAALTDLSNQFVIASSIGNLLLWLVLGVALGVLLLRSMNKQTTSAPLPQ